VQNGKTALLSPAGNQDAFNRNLINLLDDSSLRNTLGKGGWDFVKERFHYTRLVKDMVDVYESIL
jgi:glycosyltransferase involved in cell wall biosynthesis